MEFMIFNTPLTQMAAAEEDGAIVRVWLPNMPTPALPSTETPLLNEAAAQICDYLMGMRDTFDLPLRPQGTAFQHLVWDAMLTIPFGQTRSYGAIARQIGRPKAVRAVGGACHANPIPILIPCHRVTAANGKPGGFAGGTELKQELLNLERCHSSYVIGQF